MMKAAPPFCPVSMGKRHTFPSPTAEPAAASIAPIREVKFSRFIGVLCLFPKVVYFRNPCCMSASSMPCDMASLSLRVYRQSVNTWARFCLPLICTNFLFSGSDSL